MSTKTPADQRGVLSMHAAANSGIAGDIALFFGLSGGEVSATAANAGPHRPGGP